MDIPQQLKEKFDYLNDEQKFAINNVLKGKNTLITGPGGTGKSFVISLLSKLLVHKNIKFGLTAMSGSAALLIEGRTLHSFLYVGLAEKTPLELYNSNKYKRHIIKKLKELQVLIIDEISFMGDKLFEKLSDYMSLIRNDERIFGGVQLVLFGDFAQLCPIKENYCFLSDYWQKANIECVQLITSMRQMSDKKFERILNRLRFGKCSDKTYAQLEKLKHTEFIDGIKPTKLYARNININQINQLELNKLIENGNEYKKYTTRKNEEINTPQSIAWINKMQSLDKYKDVLLCVGAQVFVTWNLDIDKKLINGTRGVIVALKENGVDIKLVSGVIEYIEYLKVFDDENLDMFIEFLPVKLAFCTSIHYTQGMTLDCIEIDLGNSIFVEGQSYVALSRARNRKSIKLIGLSRNSFKASPQVIEFYTNIKYTAADTENLDI